MNLTLGEVVQQLQDLCIAEGVSDALWLQGLWKRRRRAVNRLEVSTLHRPVQEAIKLLTARLSHPRALFPLLEALHRQCLTINRWLAFKADTQVLQNRQVVVSPRCLTSVGDELSIFLKQLVEIQLLMTASGVSYLRCSSKGDLTTVPPLKDLLDTREG